MVNRIMTKDLEGVGKHVTDIPVQLSYKMIDLFSGHLYSSPTKAIEELVFNSYDAFAQTTVVSVPTQLDQPVWVWDNGDSMDLDGLKELWLIAESHKRDKGREHQAELRGRAPVGKFGIGKLASYVLGKRISHICKTGDMLLAVTMDYSKAVTHQPSEHLLSVREIARSDLESSVPYVFEHTYDGSTLQLFDSKQNWTLVVVEQLKQLLPIGRLHWVLSTALPLSPGFRLFLNGTEVKSSKEKIKKLQTWQIGRDDEVAKRLTYSHGEELGMEKPFDYYVEINPYGRISGEVELYHDPLDTGKAASSGHSNGFFIMARRRLVNANDNRFGISTLPYGVGFNRFRAIVHADFLDNYLTANREDTDAAPKEALRKYLVEKFNEVRTAYEKQIEKEGKKESLEEHLKSIPGTLLSYPLRQAIERVSAG